jgi:hypothetical protein
MSLNLTVISPNELHRPQIEWLPVAERPVIGKDVLELLSSSMYVNPLSIYREYIQNAADAIDEARQKQMLHTGEAGRVHITVDCDKRTVRITDNGAGLEPQSFVERLVAFGASRKRGSRARGFRGVGRLAGLGYCQELIFRSRTSREASVQELRWDCRKLKALLRNQQFSEHLEKLVSEVVAIRTVRDTTLPAHFFEVELLGIVRHGNDVLIDAPSIESHLSQVAPVPFAPEFTPGKRIEATIGRELNLGNIEIHINGSKRPIYRPHRDEFEVRKHTLDKFNELQIVTIPGSNGNLAAIGWILHHGYLGAFPSNSSLKGLRLRSGNMQIGEANLLDEIFPEPRFNSWVVGEVHIVDDRILPNGRRDHFEQNVHFRNVLSQLAPLARDLVRLCRSSSIRRNWMRQFDQGVAFIRGRNAILRQGAITQTQRAKLNDEIQERVGKLEKIASVPLLDAKLQVRYRKRVKQLSTTLSKLFNSKPEHRTLERFRGAEKRLAQRLVDLIYQASDNQASARLLIDKILRKL